MEVDNAVSGGRAISVTELAGKLIISQSSAWRLLKNQLSYKPYKPKTVAQKRTRRDEFHLVICSYFRT